MQRFLLLIFLAATIAIEIVSAKCIRRPMDTEADRTVGSNGFHIKILPKSTNVSAALPEGYIPGEEYIVHLEGWKAQYTVQTFRGFSIVAIRAGSDDFSQPIGKFKGNQNVKMSSTCWHAVSHISRHPKTEVSVVWQAPLTNMGCVDFRGMVLEYQDIWYMDEGPLTKKLCQLTKGHRYGEYKKPKHVHTNSHLKSSSIRTLPLLFGHEPVRVQEETGNECCACDEAKYELSFEGIWSRQTHPKDYPTIDHLLHFSDIIGASHSAKYSQWAFGSYSTDGLKELAEWGNTHKMEQEMKKKAKEIRTIIKARGLWFPNVQGTTRAVFRTDKYHHFLSMASMIGPSPDWLVGISAINLCLSDCTWAGEKSFDLYPWDAGTDSGHTYMSPNRPTLPREAIKGITTNDPPNSPFFDPESKTMTPLARLVLKRQQVYNMECNNNGTAQAFHYETSENGGGLDSEAEAETSEDLEFSGNPGCEVGGWSPWSECSATCGKGISMRTRSYLSPVKAQTMGCKRQLVGKQFCSAAIAECHDSEAFNDMCAVSDWSAWTECSVTCGKGLRSRQRQYENAMAMKQCTLELMEKEMCIGSEGMDCSVTPDPRCRTTAWSEWSPCSVTCGEGMKTRNRLLFYPENEVACAQQTLMEKQSCRADVADCQDSRFQNREEICTEPMDQGQCSGVFPRYYFDVGRDACTRFIYTGCKGNRNNFYSLEECRQTCLNGGGSFSTMPPKQDMTLAKAEMMAKAAMPGKALAGDEQPTDEDQEADNDAEQEVESEFANGSRTVSDGSAKPSEIEIDTTTTARAITNTPTSVTNKTNRHRTSSRGAAKGAAAINTNKLLTRLTAASASQQGGGKARNAELLNRLAAALNVYSIEPYYNLATGMVCVRVNQLATALGVGDNSGSTAPVDCMVTEWSSWSECSKTCGKGGRKQRIRMIKVHPANGGQSCPPNLIERVKCSLRPCRAACPSYRSSSQPFPTTVSRLLLPEESCCVDVSQISLTSMSASTASSAFVPEYSQFVFIGLLVVNVYCLLTVT